MRRAPVAVAAVVGIFLAVQLGALALVEPFKEAGYQTVENPTDPTNSLLYIGAILVATAVMLAAIRYGVDWFIRGLVVVSAGFVSYYVFAVLLPTVTLRDLVALLGVVAMPPWLAGVPVLSLAAAAGLMAALLVHPEWYVIDAAGIVMGAGAAGLFGISFGLLPALVLLVGLAVYDAISVYGTEHMLTLASGVMDLKVPVVLVVPLTLSYSYLDAEMPDHTSDGGEEGAAAEDESAAAEDGSTAAADEGGTAAAERESTVSDGAEGPMERDAFFIGLGDAVMPTILVASAAFFLPDSVPVLDLVVVDAALPAVTAMVGTLVGLLVLMRMVVKGRAHAGLPLLNGGAIAGYLVGALAVGIPLVEALGLAPYVG